MTLGLTQGSEIHKTRPSLIVSPNEMNDHIATVIVAPLTTKLRNYPTRVNIRFRNRSGQAALDQIRTVDKTRLVKKMGEVSSATADEIAAVLVEIFRRQ